MNACTFCDDMASAGRLLGARVNPTQPDFFCVSCDLQKQYIIHFVFSVLLADSKFSNFSRNKRLAASSVKAPSVSTSLAKILSLAVQSSECDWDTVSLVQLQGLTPGRVTKFATYLGIPFNGAGPSSKSHYYFYSTMWPVAWKIPSEG